MPIGGTAGRSVVVTAGFRCRVCGAEVAVGEPAPWRCPNAGDGGHHVLAIVEPVHGDAVVTDGATPPRPVGATDAGAGAGAAAAPGAGVGADAGAAQPFVRYGSRLAWERFAASHGMGAPDRAALVLAADAAVAAVDGTGFTVTPFVHLDALSAELGVHVWAKDETHQVGGSHKARHLFPILLQLQAAELLGVAAWRSAGDRPRLAIASCGNAAIAAATLAAAARWPIEVFVPTWAPAAVLARLGSLGASITVCERRASDPAGDPCVLRFREAVAGGAVPFGVQGPENALCLDGGRTLGWELVDQAAAQGVVLDRVFVQVGGGALAACVGAALASSPSTPLHAVQTEGCAPLARAWQLAGGEVGHPGALARRWADLMWPWDDPHSEAEGILDDETYDWLAVVEAMSASGGEPVVASEAAVLAAHDLVHRLTDVDASATGTAGLAGLLASRNRVAPGEHVAVVLSGVTR